MRAHKSIKRIIRTLTTNHWIYLLLHLILFIVGLLMVMGKSSLLIAVGSSVIAAAVAGWVLFLHVWVSQERFRQMNILNKFGIEDIFPHRSVQIKQEYDTRLSYAKEGIDIMGFGLRNLREDYRREFRTWVNRTKVRILLVDPDFFLRPTQSLISVTKKKENPPELSLTMYEILLTIA